jgi:hypothetical protein
LLLAVALPLGIVASSAAAAHVGAACGFQVSATDSGQGHFEVFFDANGTAVRMQVHENTKPRCLRERCFPLCRSRAIREPFGDAWTAEVRCRHALSAPEGTDRG